MSDKEKVLIVGAGAAGLMCARTLLQKNIPVTILEATDRPGGRAMTLEGTIPVEFGPEFLHGETPLTDELMEEFHLPWYELQFDFQLYLDGKIRPLPDFWGRLCGVLDGIHLNETDVPFSEYLARFDQHSPFDQKLAKSFVQGFEAADLSLISSTALGEMKNLICSNNMQRSRRPLDGYGPLMRKLSEEVAGHIKYSQIVEEIEWKNSEVIVRGKSGEARTPFEYTCEKLVLTASIGVLKKIRIHPMPSNLQTFLEENEMGQVVKLIAEMDPEFFHAFKGNQFPFFASPDLCFTAWWSTAPVHSNFVTGWSGGDKARKLEAKSLEEKKQHFIDELAAITSQCPMKLASQIKVIHTYDWGKNPAYLGAYSYPRVTNGKRTKAEPYIEETLYLAGEAFHEEFSGTVEGALLTGRNAALEILKTKDYFALTEKVNNSIPPYTT